MQLAFVWGLVVIGSIIVALTMALVERSGSAATALLEMLAFITGLPATAAAGLPPAFVSYGALQTAVWDSLFSWGGFFLALAVAVILFLVVLATAYTKALALTVIRNKHEGKRTGFLEMFRGARAYWKPNIWYYSFFAFFAWLFIMIAIPTAILLVGKYMMGGVEQQTLPGTAIVLLVIGVVAMLLRLLTSFADAVIAQGSRSPVRDSIRFAKNHPLATLALAVGLLAAAFIVMYVLQGLSLIASTGLVLVANLLWLVIFAFWRFWVCAFVVFQGGSRSRAQRTPRA